MEHRRADKRYDRRIGVEVVHEGQTRAGSCRNLSLGGMFIEIDLALPFGARVQVSFRVPTQPEAIEVEAQVRWSEPAVAGRGGLGVRFAGLRARDVWALNKFFDRVTADAS